MPLLKRHASTRVSTRHAWGRAPRATHCILTMAVFANGGQAPTFDAATVKMGGPVVNGLININTGKSVHECVVTLANATLSACLKFAYSLTTDEQLAGPDWINQKMVRFEVMGKAPALETPA